MFSLFSFLCSPFHNLKYRANYPRSLPKPFDFGSFQDTKTKGMRACSELQLPRGDSISHNAVQDQCQKNSVLIYQSSKEQNHTGNVSERQSGYRIIEFGTLCRYLHQPL